MKILTTTDLAWKTFDIFNEILGLEPPAHISNKITPIYQHTVRDEWFLFSDDLINENHCDGQCSDMETAINTTIAAGHYSILDLTKEQLIQQGYFTEESFPR